MYQLDSKEENNRKNEREAGSERGGGGGGRERDVVVRSYRWSGSRCGKGRAKRREERALKAAPEIALLLPDISIAFSLDCDYYDSLSSPPSLRPRRFSLFPFYHRSYRI
jgi:hypothetical protein